MSDTTVAPVRMPAAKRRQQLLEFALRVFAREGYHETSMNALASEAGVTKPVLYQHFASKHDLVVEVLNRVGDRLHASIVAAVLTEETSRNRVQAGFRAFFRFFDDEPDAFAVLYESKLGAEPEFRDDALRIQATFAETVALIIHRANRDDALAMASGISGLSEGMIRHWMVRGRGRSADEMAELATRLAWGGLEQLA
ncbi:MAG: helix-turn-helix domain-containing protein [Actinomycetota bacterium]|nr:helix-turn-helix domain-containing protein [Actinomycetota bacterium]